MSKEECLSAVMQGKHVQPAVIRSMEYSDIQKSIWLLDASFGHGYVTDIELLQFIESDERFAVVASDVSGEIISGVATGIILPQGEGVRGFAPADHLDLISSLVNGYTSIGVLKSVAVLPEAQGKGIGASLSGVVTDSLTSAGVDCVLSVGWTDNEGCHIQGALTKLGYTPCADIQNFWFEESLTQGYPCPSCGNPCRCSARIFLSGEGRIRNPSIATVL